MTSIQTPPTAPPSLCLHWLQVLGYQRKHAEMEELKGDWCIILPVSLHKDVKRLTWKTTTSDHMLDAWANQ